LGNGTSWEKYDAWRIGDTKLDWYGAQKGQGTYMGTSASGTPMALTTNVKGKPEYQELNKYNYNRGQK
jgi:alpha-amylase